MARMRREVTLQGLRRFFQQLVFPAFAALGMDERPLMDYVVDLLARFARTDELYRLRDGRGQPLESVAEMLLETARLRDPQQPYSFDRELDLRRHTGDYALFISGLFRAWCERQGLLDYYLRQGEAAYRIAGELGQLSFAEEARLFAALAQRFELLSGALDYARKVHMQPALQRPDSYGRILRCMGVE